MPALLDAAQLADPSRQMLFRAMLSEHLMSFTEFAFGVIRPGVRFQSN